MESAYLKEVIFLRAKIRLNLKVKILSLFVKMPGSLVLQKEILSSFSSFLSDLCNQNTIL